MTRNKRSFMLLAVLLLLAVSLAACANTTTTTAATSGATSATSATTTAAATAATRVPLRISALKGPTGIGLVKLMADQEKKLTLNDYTFSLAGSPDDIVAQISSGQTDVAALPTNLAAVLYQKTKQQLHLLAVNTLGVLYILEKGDTVHSLADLAGKTLQASGQAAVPEYVLNELLARSNLAKPAIIEYKAEHSELATLAVSGKADLVMLPEPFVTTVLSKNPAFRIALDLTAEWKKLQAGQASELSMGCLIVTAPFAQAHPDALRNFLTEYQASVDFVNDKPVEAGAEVARFQILADAGLAAKAIPNCHIVLIQGKAMQPAVEPLYQMLLAANPRSIGEKLPNQAFYWIP